MNNNMFDDMMFGLNQAKTSNLAERKLPLKGQKMKSIRTNALRWDDTNQVNYSVHDGYNMEVSVMIFDVICAVTGVINYDNAIRAIRVIKNFVAEPVKFKVLKPKIKPIIVKKIKPKVVNFQLECKTCKDVKDVRYDFYKGRLECKECYKQSVIQKRRDKKCV